MSKKTGAARRGPSSTPRVPAASSNRSRRAAPIDFHTVTLIVVLLAVTFIRYRLLAVPLERDEGEYAYVGNLILHGGLPYRDAYNMKLPGTYAMYAGIISVFGTSPSGIHAGLMLVSLVTMVVLYLAFRRLFTPMIGLVAATVYGLLSASMFVLGSAAHATHFINLFVALGLLVYARFRDTGKAGHAAIAGVMMGLALLMKQQAAFLVACGGLLVIANALLARPARWRKAMTDALAYGGGAAAPYLGTVAIMLATGTFEKFWRWTVEYAGSYAASNDRWDVIKGTFMFSFGPIFDEYPLFWLLAGAGLIVVCLARYTRLQKTIAIAFAACSLATICPGFYFRPHYFVSLLPAVGLLVGVTLDGLVALAARWRTNRVIRVLPFVVVLLIGLNTIENRRDYYLADDVRSVSLQAYGSNLFVDAEAIGAYLARNTTAADTIAVVGSEPELLVYAGRRSATGYMYVYPLVEIQPYNVSMQHEMMGEIERGRPKYLVFVNVQTSWLLRRDSPTDILAWLQNFALAHYDIVGRVDLRADGGPSEYSWDEAARSGPRQDNYVFILKRKPAEALQ
jgi:hypothetical protein